MSRQHTIPVEHLRAAVNELMGGFGSVAREVERGVALPGLYPPNAENAARYQAWAKEQST